jgi:hypothetical protein
MGERLQLGMIFFDQSSVSIVACSHRRGRCAGGKSVRRSDGRKRYEQSVEWPKVPFDSCHEIEHGANGILKRTSLTPITWKTSR